MSFCGNDAGSDPVWRGARLVRSHGTRLGARWCEAEARQDDVSGYGAMPLLVVGFAQRVGAIRLDRASGRIGGRRVVRLERIVFRPTTGSVLPSGWRSGGTEVLPIWVMPFHWDDPARLARLVRSGRVWVCLAGIGGVPQLGQSPDDQALLEGDD